MSPEDDRQLRSLVRQAVEASPLGVRQLERAMGLGSGYLQRLLDGRMEIKVRHLVDLARLLRVPPSHFLHLGCPDANRSAVTGLGKVLGLKEQPDPFLASRAPGEGVPASREELVDDPRRRARDSGVGGVEEGLAVRIFPFLSENSFSRPSFLRVRGSRDASSPNFPEFHQIETL